jgi:hypothetical protein
MFPMKLKIYMKSGNAYYYSYSVQKLLLYEDCELYLQGTK